MRQIEVNDRMRRENERGEAKETTYRSKAKKKISDLQSGYEVWGKGVVKCDREKNRKEKYT